MTTEHRAAIFHDIDTERAVQDAKWGGPEHDDKHVIGDWVGYIRDHAERAQFGRMSESRRQMVRVAALAVAAIESIDRQACRVPAAKPVDARGQAEADLAAIVGKTGDLGIRAIAAMANISEDDVRRALAQDRAWMDDRDRLVADANVQADGRRRAGEGLRHILGLLGMPKDTPLVLVDDAERLAAALLSELWVRRDGVSPSQGDHDHDAVTSQLRADALTGQRPVCPPPGWTLKPSWTGGCDALDGPGESRIRIEPWGFAVTDADGDEAAAGVAAMRCAMAIHEKRYGGASDPSTVTVQVLTSADIERLVLLFYWLTTKMPWHDLLGAIIDSAGVDMTSPGAEALARELVAELLRKNNGDDHGCG